MPVPASSGRPRLLTRPPNRPVLRAWSKLATADRNCGELTICCMASEDGGMGKSGGRCGSNECKRSGWLSNRGVILAGVRTSVNDSPGVSPPAWLFPAMDVKISCSAASCSRVAWKFAALADDEDWAWEVATRGPNDELVDALGLHIGV